MKTAKAIVFWCTMPFTFILVLLFGLLEAIAEWGQEALHWFEGWCFDYKKHNVYRGGGIWTGKTDQHYDDDHLNRYLDRHAAVDSTRKR